MTPEGQAPEGEGTELGTSPEGEGQGGEGQAAGTPPVEEGGAGQEGTPASGTPAEGEGDPEAGGAPDDTEGLSERAQDKVNKRINKLTREKYDLMSENDRLKAAGGQEQKPNNQPATDLPVMPKYEDFDDVDEYNKKMSEYSRNMVSYEIDQRDKTRTEAETQTQAQERKYKSIENFEVKADEYRKKNPDSDFDQVAMSPEALMIYDRNDDFTMMVQDSEVVAELAHYLGANLGVLDELASMPIHEAAKELGRLEARIEQSGGIKPRAVSKAGEPIKPVGGGQGVVTKDPSDMSDDEFIKWRRDHIAKRN